MPHTPEAPIEREFPEPEPVPLAPTRWQLPARAEAVLLDLDGTLSEAGPAIAAAVTLALEHVGRAPVDEAVLRSFVGPPLEDSFAALPGFDDVLVTEAVRVYRVHHDQLASPLYAGVPELLEQLTGLGLRLAVATSKPEPLAELLMREKGLLPLFETVVGSDRPAGRLTKGDVVAVALDRLGRPPATVMVGDRRYDVEGAAEHGVPCIGVLWGYGNRTELLEAGAAALAERPSDVLRLLTAVPPPLA